MMALTELEFAAGLECDDEISRSLDVEYEASRRFFSTSAYFNCVIYVDPFTGSDVYGDGQLIKDTLFYFIYLFCFDSNFTNKTKKYKSTVRRKIRVLRLDHKILLIIRHIFRIVRYRPCRDVVNHQS